MAYQDQQIPEIRKRPKPIAPGLPGYDATVGPPALVRPPAPVNAPGGVSVVANPTGQQLNDAGALRPAASPTEVVPFSRDNPQPMAGGDGRLLPAVRQPIAQPAVQRLPTQVVTPNDAPAAIPGTYANPAAANGSQQRLPTQTVTAPQTPGVGIVPTRVAGISEVAGNPDGSRTFTDRPDATAAALATRGTLRNANAVPTAERDAYLASVPTLGSGPTITRPTAGGGGLSPLQAARFAQSDAAAVANQDTRSVAGNAARNAAIERDYAGPQTRTQRQASNDAYQQTINGLLGPGAQLAQATADAQKTAAQEAGANTRAQIGADAGTAQAQISRPRQQSQQVTLADGTIAQIGENGVSRPVVDAKGLPIQAARGKEPQDQAAYAKLFESNLSRVLGVDPLTGLIPDPNNPKQGRAPTPDEQLQATRAARALTLEALGGQGSQAANGAESDVQVDANGNKARLVNGKYIPVE